eukprot:scaffold2623_cov250-Pinguiococcus_pyrenoidosus.AAC.10
MPQQEFASSSSALRTAWSSSRGALRDFAIGFAFATNMLTTLASFSRSGRSGCVPNFERERL